MRTTPGTTTICVLLALLAALTCTPGVLRSAAPSALPAAAPRLPPGSIMVDGRVVHVTVTMWRNEMPLSFMGVITSVQFQTEGLRAIQGMQGTPRVHLSDGRHTWSPPLQRLLTASNSVGGAFFNAMGGVPLRTGQRVNAIVEFTVARRTYSVNLGTVTVNAAF